MKCESLEAKAGPAHSLTVSPSDGSWWRLLGLAGRSHADARRRPLQKGSGIGDHRLLSTEQIRNRSVSYASAILLSNWGCLQRDKFMQLIWLFLESICLAEDGDKEAFYVFLLSGNPIFFSWLEQFCMKINKMYFTKNCFPLARKYFGCYLYLGAYMNRKKTFIANICYSLSSWKWLPNQ